MAVVAGPTVRRTRERLWLQFAPFMLGATIGALASALVVMVLIATAVFLLGAALTRGIEGLFIIAAIGHDAGFGVPVPYRRKQVPEVWQRAHSPATAFFLYGAVLGLGFATMFTSPAHLAFLAGIPWLRSLPLILGTVLMFVAGKALVLLTASGISSHESAIRAAALAAGTRRTRTYRSLWAAGLSMAVIICSFNAPAV